MWALYGVVVAEVEAHGTIGSPCGARWAGSLREGHTEAWYSAHLYGAGAGVVLGGMTVLVTRPLAFISRLFHTEEPGTPVQQNHPNLKEEGIIDYLKEEERSISQPFLTPCCTVIPFYCQSLVSGANT